MGHSHIAYAGIGLLVALSMGICGCRGDLAGGGGGSSSGSTTDVMYDEGQGEGEECSDSETRDTFRPFDEMDKPVVYLYPESETDVTVSIEHPDWLTCTYPETEDGSWSVVAEPDGTLTDKVTGRSLYALYYEATAPAADVSDEGFVVGRRDLVPFLEEKLATVGLTEREAEEFIVWWLPQMREYDRCLVRFSLTATEQELNRLDVSPAPDHLIRIRMIWKGYDDSESIPPVSEQELTPVDRPSLDGFVAVEWGGTELR